MDTPNYGPPGFTQGSQRRGYNGPSGNFGGGGGGGGGWLQTALGFGLSGIGSFLGARSQNNAQQEAINANRLRQQQIDQMTNPYTNVRGPQGQWMGGQQSPWEVQLQNMFGGMQAQRPNQFTPERLNNQNIDPSLINTQRFDTAQGGGVQMPEWMGNAQMNDVTMGDRYMDFNRLSDPGSLGGMANSSQDALMQLIRGGGGGQTQAAMAGNVGLGGLDMNRWAVGVDPITGQVSQTSRNSMESLVGNGANFEGTQLNQALKDSAAESINRQALMTQGSAGSMGQRFGTALSAQEGRQRSEMQTAANLQQQQAAQSSYESAQGRRLGAAQNLNAQDSIINNVLMANQGNMVQQGGLNLNAQVSARGQDAQVAGANAGVNIANANNQTQASMQNANQRLQAATALAQSQGNNMATMMSGLNSRNGNIAQLLGSGMDTSARLAMGNQQTNNQAMIARNGFNQNNTQMGISQNQLLAQLMGQNANATNNTNQFNESNRLNVGQFNNNMGLNAFQANNQAGQFHQQQLMQMLQMGLGQNNMADNRALQALGIRAGMPQQQANSAAGSGWNALGDAGNAMLMWQMMNQRPQGQNQNQGQGFNNNNQQSYNMPWNPGSGVNQNTGLGIRNMAGSGMGFDSSSMNGGGTPWNNNSTIEFAP